MHARTLRKVILVLVWMVAGAIPAAAQYSTSGLSFMQRNFFHSLGGSFAGIFGNSPAIQMTSDDYGAPVTYYRKRDYVGVFNFNYEPRVNVYNVRDFFSLSIAAPVGISAGDNNDSFGLMLRAGAFAQANFFYHATYNNIDMRGFYLGWGPYRIMNLSAPEDGGAQAWTHWTFRGGLKRQGKRMGWQYGIMYAPPTFVSGIGDKEVRELGMFQYEIGIILGYGK